MLLGGFVFTQTVWCRVPKGTVDAVLSYCHNTLNDKSLLDMLPYFAEKSVGVISASVTSMGLFTKQVITFPAAKSSFCWNSGRLRAKVQHIAYLRCPYGLLTEHHGVRQYCCPYGNFGSGIAPSSRSCS